MPRVNLIVEGQTEETFVRDFLKHELAQAGAYLAVRCVETGRKKVKVYRGGMTNYSKAKNDIVKWLKEDTSAYLTTMFDLYALPDDFPGMGANHIQGIEKAVHIESELAKDIGDARFLPYIQTHEFEALLFSDPMQIDNVIPDCNIANQMRHIRGQYESPEHINGGPTTAPSKRILNLHQGYNKVLYGMRVSRQIGLPRLLAECPHFNSWIDRLKALP